MRSFIYTFRLHLCVALIAASGAALAASAPDAASIGAARVIVADVSAQGDAAKRRLAVDDPVQFRELISTAAESAAVLVLADGTELAMGENAKLRLDEFVLGDGDAAKLWMSLDFGALRFVTGDLPKPAYAVRTPRASLTVRGTIFDLAVGGDGAAYVAVRAGVVTVTTADGRSLDLPAGQSLAIDAAGTAGLPQPALAVPSAGLPAQIAAMDLTLAGQIDGLGGAALDDLSVLDASRDLAAELADKPGIERKDGPGGERTDRDRPDRKKRDRRFGDKDRTRKQ